MEKEGNLEKQRENLRKIALRYYSRKDIQTCLINQARTVEGAHEIVPKYYDGFGKRPDTLEYPQDVYNLVLRGATSFHVSEEIWKDPLELETNLKEEQLNKLRVGWNLILDVDCKFIEYSKVATWLLCEALYFHGIRNLGLKFSGGSGFHIGLSYKAFPEVVQGVKIKDFFPQGPRVIAAYLKEMIRDDLKKRIMEMNSLNDIAKFFGKPIDYFYKKKCKKCGVEPIKKREIDEISRKEIEGIMCPKCYSFYEKSKDSFEIISEFDPFSILEIDTILIASRHLYRMAYSLHEKTGLASIVLKPEQLKAFHPGWAKADRVIVKRFIPEPEHNEAKELFTQALDWHAREQRKKEQKLQEKEIRELKEAKARERTPIKFTNINEEIYPPCIKIILQGMKQDGRKRALFILINFLRNLGLSFEDIEKRLGEWNKANYRTLKDNYIATQLNWFKRQEARLPPNCNLRMPQSWYKELGVCMPDFICQKIKNPVNYVVLKSRINNKDDKIKKIKGEKEKSSHRKRTKVF